MANSFRRTLREDVLRLADRWSMVAERLTTAKVEKWVRGELEVDWGNLPDPRVDVEDAGEELQSEVKGAVIALEERRFIATWGTRGSKTEEIVYLRERGERELARIERHWFSRSLDWVARQTGLSYRDVAGRAMAALFAILGALVGSVGTLLLMLLRSWMEGI